MMRYSYSKTMEFVDEYLDELHGWDALSDIKSIWDFDDPEGTADVIQEQYTRAMSRRNTYIGNACGWVLSGVPRVYEYQGSYLVGRPVGVVFIISHFAPKTLRGGYDMVKALPFPAVAAVLDAQASMLQRAGWRYLGTVPQPFGGELVMKRVMASPRVHTTDVAVLLDYVK